MEQGHSNSENVKKKPTEGTTDEDNEDDEKKKKNWNYIRSLVAFFILGVTNNYGYVVMLSGAHDIINELEKHAKDENAVRNERDCTQLSTGAILLADIIPSFFIKLVAPFFPLCIHFRVFTLIFLAVAGLLLVAFGRSKTIAIIGVILTSLTSGLGELTYLQYSSFYHINVLSTWSSGTGGAGILGAISYTLFSLISIKVAMLCGLLVPGLMAFAFWVILPTPDPENKQIVLQQKKREKEERTHEKQPCMEEFKMKIKLIPGLLRFMIPLSTVYLFEYFINQGIYELIFFEDIFMGHSFQYKTLQILYQVGVFLSRSSVNVYHFKQIWIMSVFQFINVIVFICEGIYYYMPSIWIIFILTLWEGCIGGAAYVNTYFRITNEIHETNKQFSISMTSISDTIGITLAGILAMPTHNAICKLPKPERG